MAFLMSTVTSSRRFSGSSLRASSFMDFFTGDPNLNEDELDYLLISREVLPALVDAGVTPAQIQTMLVDTPRRFFGGDA